MPVLTAEISDRAKRRLRMGERRRVATDAQCRRGIVREKVDVLDLSLTGARVRAVVPLRVGHTVFIKFAGMEGLEARIVWTVACESGCEFANPLHPAVFDRLARAG